MQTTYSSLEQHSLFSFMTGSNAPKASWAQGRQRSVMLCVLVVCGTYAMRLLEEWLFSEDDAGVSELCILGAFAALSATCFRRRPANTKAPRGSGRSEDSTIDLKLSQATEDDSLARGRRRPLQRQGLVAGGRRRASMDAASTASSEESYGPELVASAMEGVAAACRARDMALAEERLGQLLSTAGSTHGGAEPPLRTGGDSEAPERPRSHSGSGPVRLAVHAMVEACLEAGEAERATAWLEALHADGIRPAAKTLLVALQALVASEQLQEAEQFFARMLAAGAQGDAACHHVVFEHCIPAGDAAGVEAWLARLARLAQCRPQEQSQAYVALLRSRRHTGSAAQADLWMSRATEAGAARTSHVFNAAIHACARAGDVDRAEQWLQRLEEASASEVHRRRAGEQHLAPDVISYSAVMDACAQRGEGQRAEAWFAKMVAAGICPDTVSYNTVIKAHARGGDIAGAERWLHRAREQGVPLDAFGYNAVIAAAARAADPEKAEWWLHRMIEDAAEPDAVSYNSVINAWAKRKDAAGAERLVRLMCQNAVEPDVVTLGVAVHACAQTGDVRRAEAVFERIVARGRTQPDAIGYNALINAAVKAGDTARAESWLARMLEDGVAPSVVSYTTVLHAHARSGDIQAAEKGMERMLGAGVEANVVSYSALIHACVQAGDVDRAEKWFRRMREAGVQANAVSYSALLNVCAKAGEHARAERWLEAMSSDGVAPNVVCYNNVIDSCAKAGRPERAELWLRRLAGQEPCGPSGSQQHGLAPTRQSYTTAAQAYAAQGLWRDAERILAEMESRGISMDEFSLTVLLSAYSRARPRQRERAEAAYRRHAGRGLPVTRPPLRVLRSVVGGQRFDRLMLEQRAQVPPGEGAF